MKEEDLARAGQEAQQEPSFPEEVFDIDELLNSLDSNMQIPACTPDPIHVLSSTPNGVPIQAITPARSELETMAGTSRSRRRTLSYLEESQASSKDEETKLSDELPFPNKFSIKVQKAIDADKVLSVRRELIAELASFYSTLSKYPHQGDYKRMALKVCDQFPDLRDSNPSHYWSSVQMQLSQYFRNHRRGSKCCKSPKSGGRVDPKPYKRARLSSYVGDDELSQGRNLELLSSTEVGSLSCDLGKETFLERRKYITEVAKSCKEILDRFPYLRNSSQVWSDLHLLLGNCVTGAEDRLARGLKVILDHGGETLTNAQVVAAIKSIQQETKRKTDNQDVFKFQDQTTPPERLFRDKEILLTCIGSVQKIYRVFVSGECRAFFESDCDLVKALVDLISTYYVFNVPYPKSLSGLLHFLQEVALMQSDSKYNLIRYATFMGKFRKKSLICKL